ncbi:cytokine-inducible SH2-containing protein-like [Denticeps clupeoides]|nr:cytokine-inducible SH2-containing protein-like [Denticeps clupeoides]
MILCIRRVVLPSSAMVAREMNLPSDGDGREPMESDPGHLRPSFPCSSHDYPMLWDPTKDLCCLRSTFHHLHTSGWYWGGISAAEAKDLLIHASEGTFLVRDSSHPLFMLTLSVKTQRGPTNVRIEYSRGQFRLDSSSPELPRLMSFPDIPSLVHHYVSSSQAGEEAKPGTAVPPKDNVVLLKLRRPFRQPEAFPSLQHLTRLTINRHAVSLDQLPLPGPLRRFLQEYPFQV